MNALTSFYFRVTLDLHTQDSHVIFALLFILLNEIVKVVSEVLEEMVLFVDLQTQDAI